MSDDEDNMLDEEGTFEDDGNGAYDYDFNDEGASRQVSEQQKEQKHAKAGGKLMPPNIPPQLLREVSSGYYLHIPYNDYIVQPGAESAILPLLHALAAEVASFICISEDEALTLLLSVGYSKERLLENYFVRSNQYREAAGIQFYDAVEMDNQLSSAGSTDDNNSLMTCTVCFDDKVKLNGESFGLGCGHRFCRNCFNGHLRAKISDGPSCIMTTCPQRGCKELCTNRVFHALLQDPEDVHRYEKFLVANFITKTSFIRYCPGANCGHVAIGSGVNVINCNCGKLFCFHCGEEAHDPSSCQQLRDWTAKNHDESENVKWILAYTKKCPNSKCGNNIEKNEGCNHMTCSMCRHEFCWICLGNWANHGGSYYQCNKFDASVVKNAVDEAARARHELERYMHYFKRYQNHEVSLKYANTLLAQAQAALYARLEANPGLILGGSEEYLISAAKQLLGCRRVLMYTYVMGFYLPDDTPEKHLFEFQQALLEETTDRLQELAKSPDSGEPANRAEILRLTEVVRGFFDKLTLLLQGGAVNILSDSNY